MLSNRLIDKLTQFYLPDYYDLLTILLVFLFIGLGSYFSYK